LNTIILLVLAVVAIILFVMASAGVEMYRDIRQLREISGILDTPLNIDIGQVAQKPPSNFGLPFVLDEQAAAIVLFLNERCSPCRSIAASFDASAKYLPNGLWIILEARTLEVATQFLHSTPLNYLQSDGRVIVDHEGEIARRIGLETSPVGFRIANGKISMATTVPSSRYLLSILPHSIRLKEPNSSIPIEVSRS
jgi:hypothetical protein